MTKKYTQQELNYIKNNYKTMSNDEIGNKLGFTREAIRKKLKRMNLKKTDEEIKINFHNNKHKNGSSGIFHPLYKTHRSEEVKNKISKKLTYKEIPYKRKTIHFNGRTIKESHYIWYNQPGNLPYIPKGFVIHHYDGNSENNSSDNLIMIPRTDHQKIHCQISKIIRSEL